MIGIYVGLQGSGHNKYQKSALAKQNYKVHLDRLPRPDKSGNGLLWIWSLWTYPAVMHLIPSLRLRLLHVSFKTSTDWS